MTLAKLVVLTALVGCGGSQHAASSEPGPTAPAARPAARDAHTPIERRRDAACEQLGPRLTACAVEDAKADLAAGRVSQQQFDSDTAPAVLRKNTEQFLDACRHTAYSSRQIRVLEVCPREETRCAPLLACLGHLDDK
jgi:hypothetical protein